MGEVLGEDKEGGGDRREWGYPVLASGEERAISDVEKVKLMVRSFAKVHGLENLSEEGIRRMEVTLSLHLDAVGSKEEGILYWMSLLC